MSSYSASIASTAVTKRADSPKASSAFFQVTTDQTEETRALGERLAAQLLPGDVVALIGPLGSGKTVFVQGVCRGLEVTSSVLSPTFALVHEYDGLLPVYHIDCNRISEPQEMIALGLDEYIDKRSVCIIEWAERLSGCLPPETIEVTFRTDSESASRRYIAIQGLRSGAAL